MGDQSVIPVKLCAYCGIEPAVESEHVIARCIIPPPRPTMITVPACAACNDKKKHDDEHLRDMLAIDIENEGHPTTSGEMKEKVIRAIGRKQSDFVKQARGKSIYEVRRTVSGISLGYASRAYTDPERINAIFAWIVRGLLFEETGDRLPVDCIFKAGKVNLGHHADAIADLQGRGGKDGPSIPPSFESFYLRAKSDPTVSHWILRFFNVHVWVTTNFEKYA
ncbi:MAG: hypothetical protein JWM11_6464 [Planctomycetaceae bacterium]|nr:hypothetical protein [Planctomycetaceae bacterium]